MINSKSVSQCQERTAVGNQKIKSSIGSESWKRPKWKTMLPVHKDLLSLGRGQLKK